MANDPVVVDACRPCQSIATRCNFEGALAWRFTGCLVLLIFMPFFQAGQFFVDLCGLTAVTSRMLAWLKESIAKKLHIFLAAGLFT